MHVAIVSRGLPSPGYPTYGSFEFDQAKSLAKYGHKVDYYAVDTRSVLRRRRMGIDRQQIEGVHVCVISLPLGRVPDCITIKLGALALKKQMEEDRRSSGRLPDVIHAHFAIPGLQAAYCAESLNIPLIYTEHCSLLLSEDARYSALASGVLRRAVAVIAVSNRLANAVRKLTDKRVEVVPNLVSDVFFDECDAVPDNWFSIVTVGALIYRKGYDLLLEAFAKARLDKTKLRIIGKGPLEHALISQAKNLGIYNRVDFLGEMAPENVARAMQASNLFVLASRAETFGVVYAEAMAAGVPVIATDCGGPSDFVEKECGLIIPVDDLSHLVSALTYMRDKISLYDRSCIRHYAAQNFAGKSVAAKITGVYEAVV